jgi:hypothetical protein
MYMQFFQQHLLKKASFLQCILCQKSYGCRSVGLCLGLLFSSMSTFVPVPGFLLLGLYSIVWSQLLCYLQHCSFDSGLLWLFEFVFPYELWIDFSISVKNVILIGTAIEHIDCFQECSHFHNIDSADPWAWDVLFSFLL